LRDNAKNKSVAITSKNRNDQSNYHNDAFRHRFYSCRGRVPSAALNCKHPAQKNFDIIVIAPEHNAVNPKQTRISQSKDDHRADDALQFVSVKSAEQSQ
jgi:hypothetical protein